MTTPAIPHVPFPVPPGQMLSIVMGITPAIATDWLKLNTKNRRINRTTIERYRRDMLEGRWRLTHQGIAFDSNSSLSDGQHRLEAVAQLPEGSVININVTFNLDPESQGYMDQGRVRSAAGQLSIGNVKNASVIASGVRILLVWENGLLFRDNANRRLITNPYIEQWVDAHPDQIETLQDCVQDMRSTDLQLARAAAAGLAFAAIDPQMTRQFFRMLASGAGLSDGHPVLALRNRMASARRNRQNFRERDELGMIIRAWNAWRDAKPLKRIENRPFTADTFPEPR